MKIKQEERRFKNYKGQRKINLNSKRNFGGSKGKEFKKKIKEIGRRKIRKLRGNQRNWRTKDAFVLLLRSTRNIERTTRST